MRQVTFFRVRLGSGEEADRRALNAFLAEVKVRKIVPSLVTNALPNYWSIYVEYDADEVAEKKPGPATGEDDVLQGEELRIYEELRQWRNQRAKEERIQPYMIFHNAHLREIVKQKVASIEEIAQIWGVGPVRAQRYGKDILGILSAFSAPSHRLNKSP